MVKKIFLVFVLFMMMTDLFPQTTLFDFDWRFLRGTAQGAEAPSFDDSMWRKIDLPHDWSIENLPGTQSPFHPDAITKMSGGWSTGGTGWYRKTFNIPSQQVRKRILIQFDGVYMNSDVWLNGHHLGNHPYGYTSFWYDITDKINFGGGNVIAVEVKNKGLNSRWYSGSGIYRHVWLKVMDPVSVEPWGIFITTKEAEESQAIINVKTLINNTSHSAARVKLVTRILNPKGAEISKNELRDPLSSGLVRELLQDLKVSNPELWSVESPVLYTAVTELYNNDILVSHTETKFGIREISYDAVNGFLLNGKKLELKGGCMHHDDGILGSAAFDRAEERKVELLKSNGFNAVRCSHNPPSEAFLDACDRLGILVIDEAFDMWQEPKNPEDYHLFFDQWWERDMTSMILRDRNHPSVIFWSLGNEISERADSSGIEIMKKFRTVIGKMDTSRPLTLAVCEFWDHPGRTWEKTAPAFEQVDVGGYNYQWVQYEPDHIKYPKRVMMGTESVPMQAFQNWQMVEKLPYVIGDFVWTTVDYLGEAGIGHTTCKSDSGFFLMPWPWFNANCGDIDLIGNKKPQSYFRDVVWRRSKIEMAVHAPLPDSCKEKVSFWGWPDEQQNWTWPGHEGKIFKVNVYSHSGMVRLELNGKAIGDKPINDTSMLTATFDVPYEPGILKAVALENGKPMAEVILNTTGEQESIRLVADRPVIKAVRNELSYVSVEVTDKNGNVVPYASANIRLSSAGPGIIVAAGNGNASDAAGFQNKVINSYRGRGLVILKSDGNAGEITVEATSQGLKPAKIIINAKK
jgi:beta-galactosidase